MKAYIKAIQYYLPDKIITNDDITKVFPDWTADKIEEKTGIVQRHIASDYECASDLAFQAANKLFASGVCSKKDIDFLLLCTQSPDYFLPTTACLLQDRLGLSNSIGAFDFNLGCSGYIYGLSIAKGLIESGQAKNILLITAETYSKFIQSTDKGTVTIFGDGAAATLLQSMGNSVNDNSKEYLGPFVFGTDGKGGKNLIVQGGAMRDRKPTGLYMNGPEIFAFTFKNVPISIQNFLVKAGCSLDEIDLFVFHQANKYMLEHLREKIGIPQDKFFISMKNYGNTVSSTIPIALKDALDSGRLKIGDKVMLVGFGVGYSWAVTVFNNYMKKL